MKSMACAFVFVSLATSAHAQSGVLTGSVFDSHHQAVPSAKVSLQGAGQKEARTAQTDAAGVYRFTVPGGNYTIRAETSGLGEASVGPISVTADETKTADVIIQAQYFDEPQFTVAGVTDNTYRGGHGSDSVLRSAEALTKATAALSQPDTADPHHALGEKDERTGHPLEAVQEFQRAAELNPSEPNLFDWGTELLAHRAPQAAAEVFTRGVRLFPHSVRMLLGLASARYASGAYEEAATGFFQAADVDPGDPNPYRFLNEVQHREITQSAGYEERLARFAKLRPDNALANYYYAVALWNRHADSREARALLQKALQLDPRLGPAHLQLGIVYAAEQNYPEAIREYQRAIDASPDLQEAHYRLSEAYRLAGDHSKAQQEMAVYNQLSKQSAEKLERERREVRQFVIALRSQ